jgi:hypothetical protein
MRYMLMMNAPRGEGDWQVTSWSPDDLKAHIGFMRTLNDDLRKRGELVAAEGLAKPGEAKLVRMNKSGGPPVTDGVFPESKEFLAGFWIVDVETTQRVYELAAYISSAPGPGGKPLVIPVEVRQVMSAPPEV